MFLFLLIASVVLYIYVKFWRPLNYWEKASIPYVKPWPVVGNMLPFITGQTSLFYLMQNLYNALDARYFGIWSFTEPVILIKDVEILKQILIKDFEHFIDHESVFNATNEPIFSENLFAAKGQKWRELRSILSPAFSGSRLRSMFSQISNCALRATNYLEKSAKDNSVELEIREFYKRCSIDILAACAYGIKSNSIENKNNEFYLRTRAVGDFSGWASLKLIGYAVMPKIMRALKTRFITHDQIEFFRNIVSNTIAFRERNGVVSPNLLHNMIEARKEQLKFEDPKKVSDAGLNTVAEPDIGNNSKTKLDITDDLMIAQAIFFFVTGTDTITSSLLFCSYELARNIDIQKKLQDEIEKADEECNGEITYEIITKMKYLDTVIIETLRMWPQGYFTDRLCAKDFVVQPSKPDEKVFVIKKGQVIWIPSIGFHKDPKYFPDPERFDPERFSDENKKNNNPYAYLPFGLGPRSCIATRFAFLVIKVFLYHILRNFNIVVTEKTEIPLKISKSQILLNSANDIWLEFQNRE